MDPTTMKWAGTLGFWLIEASYVPQVTRLYRLKEAEEFSLLFPSLNLLGRLLVLVYSLIKGDSIVMWGVAVGIVLRTILLTQVGLYRYRRRLQLRLQEEIVSI